MSRVKHEIDWELYVQEANAAYYSGDLCRAHSILGKALKAAQRCSEIHTGILHSLMNLAHEYARQSEFSKVDSICRYVDSLRRKFPVVGVPEIDESLAALRRIRDQGSLHFVPPGLLETPISEETSSACDP